MNDKRPEPLRPSSSPRCSNTSTGLHLLLALVATIAVLTFGYMTIAYLINPNHIKVGMNVTNGYCSGQISEIMNGQGKVLNADCGKISYNYLWLDLNDLTEKK